MAQGPEQVRALVPALEQLLERVLERVLPPERALERVLVPERVLPPVPGPSSTTHLASLTLAFFAARPIRNRELGTIAAVAFGSRRKAFRNSSASERLLAGVVGRDEAGLSS